MERIVATSHGVITYELTYKDIKNINMRITQSGLIRVSCPTRTRVESIDEFVVSKSEWIMRALSKRVVNILAFPRFDYNDGDNLYYLGSEYKLVIMMSTRNNVSITASEIIIRTKDITDKRGIVNSLQSWYIKECDTILVNIFERLSAKYSNRFGSKCILKLANSKSKWGSCIPSKRTIMLSQRLICFSPECINYIVIHELSHLIECNHSPKFYKVVSSIIPEYKTYRTMLRDAKIRGVIERIFAK